MPNPDLKIELLKPEEADIYIRIRHEVFRGTVNRILYSRAEGCEPGQKTFDRIKRDNIDGMVNKGHIYLKCTDTTTGEVIAGARWRYVKPKQEGATERTWEEVEEGFALPEPYEEMDPVIFNELMELFSASKREFLARRPYYCLDTLVTLQQHARRGAGSMLVKWGCDRADEAGVEAYLEASPMGAPLYAKHEFEKMKIIHFDMKKYGQDEDLDFILMRRPAKSSSTP